MENLEGNLKPKLNISNENISGEKIIEDNEKKLIAKKSIERAFSLLNERQLITLKMRLGIKPYKKRHTLQEIAEKFGVTIETTRKDQIHAIVILNQSLHKDFKKAGYDNLDINISWRNNGIDNILTLIENVFPELL